MTVFGLPSIVSNPAGDVSCLRQRNPNISNRLAGIQIEYRSDLPASFHEHNRIAIGASGHIDHKACLLPNPLGKAEIDWIITPAIHHESCVRGISGCHHHLSKGRGSARQKDSVATIGSGYVMRPYCQR